LNVKNMISSIACICIITCLLIVPVQALTDIDSPLVRAVISDGVISIEASDDGSGVEAVYVNDVRVNYRVDDIVKISAREYGRDGEEITVYAVDFTGNVSDKVILANPYYTAPQIPAVPPIQKTPNQPILPPEINEIPEIQEEVTEREDDEPPVSESAIPTEVSEPTAFTPDGTGTVVDDIVEQNGKEFFSITTEAGNIFYLIVDRHRDSENVYLLNSVTEEDLMSLAENPVKKTESAIPVVDDSESEATPPETVPAEETPADDDNDNAGGNNNTLIFVGVGAVAVLGAGVYIKIIRPKRQISAVSDDENETYNDENDNDSDDYDDEYDDDEHYDEEESEYDE
jgi:hypothetical protein